MRHVSPRLADLTARAQSLTSAGDLTEAHRVLSDALAPVDVDPLRATPELAEAAALHARILITLGDPYAARAWAGFAQAAQHRLHGPRDERTLAATAAPAAVLHRVVSHARAADLYRDIVEQLTATDGPDSARVLAAEADLATAEHAGGHCAAARTRLAEAWRRHRDLYGDAALASIKMLARLGAMERECGLGAVSRDHLTLAQELCARYLPGEHPLTVQVATLARAPVSGRHVCRQTRSEPAGVTPVGAPGVTALHREDTSGGGRPDDGGYPPDQGGRHYGTDLQSLADTAPRPTVDPETDRLLPVPVPQPGLARSRRPVIVAGIGTVGLVVAAAAIAATIDRDGDQPVAAPLPSAAPITATASPPGSSPSGSVPTGSPPAGSAAAPTDVALRDVAGGVTLQWRYPSGAEGPVLISGGRTGQPRQAFQQLPAGSTTYVVYGLNERENYCFTVSVVYSVDSIAASEPVCTARG